LSGARSSLCLLAFGLALPRAAWANGAFPDEFSIHFPVAAPDRIIVGANFGLMVSEDRGATWRYVCEPYVTEDSSDPLALINVIHYQVGAADGQVFLVATNYKVRRTGDDGCAWSTSGGAITALNASDVFPSPTDSQFVVAIGVNPGGAGSSLVASHDGAATFDTTLNTDPNLFASVEVSAGATAGTGTIYATVSGPGIAKFLGSDDLGATWPKSSSYDLPALPNGSTQVARIIAIDPEDASTVYLRLLGPPDDAIAIATAGGQSITVAQSITGSAFTAFARGTDKTLYAGTSDGKLYIRPPGATAFNAPISGPHLRCLGQRFGNTTDLYACGDMFQDGFSVGVSHDKGQTFQKVMKLSEMQGTLTCPAVQAKCAAHWARIQSVFATDGGTTTPDGGGGQQPGSKGGSCSTTGAGPFAALALLAAALRKRAHRA
jgi:hypothetical protein